MALSLVTKSGPLVVLLLLLGTHSSSSGAFARSTNNMFHRCLPPFFYFQSECFYFNTLERLSWDDARKACQELGGDLAEPRNFYAFFRVKNQALGDIDLWLGASDAQKEGRWVGVSGKQYNVDSMPWAPEEPNNAGGTDNYLMVMKDGLNDHQGYEKHYFACEYQLY